MVASSIFQRGVDINPSTPTKVKSTDSSSIIPQLQISQKTPIRPRLCSKELPVPTPRTFQSEPDLIQISWRNDYVPFKMNDGSGALCIDKSRELTFFQRFLQTSLAFLLVHYVWYNTIAFVLCTWLWHFGYKVYVLIAILLYLPSFFSGAQFKGEGRPWTALRNGRFWGLIQSYNRMVVVRESKLDPSRQYIFGIYPHSILILSRVSQYGGCLERLFPGIDTRALGASPMFYVAGCREICLWMGAINANKRTAIDSLRKGKSLIIFPDGSKGIFLTDPKSKVTRILGRRGFIKLALQNGVSLVPTFVFGEKHLFTVNHLPKWLTNFFMKTIKTPLILFHGRFFTWLPKNDDKAKISVVYGKPILIDNKIADPTSDEIEVVYQKFMNSIRDLFERYKKSFGYEDDETLEIIDADTKPSKEKNT